MARGIPCFLAGWLMSALFAGLVACGYDLILKYVDRHFGHGVESILRLVAYWLVFQVGAWLPLWRVNGWEKRRRQARIWGAAVILLLFGAAIGVEAWSKVIQLPFLISLERWIDIHAMLLWCGLWSWTASGDRMNSV